MGDNVVTLLDAHVAKINRAAREAVEASNHSLDEQEVRRVMIYLNVAGWDIVATPNTQPAGQRLKQE